VVESRFVECVGNVEIVRTHLARNEHRYFWAAIVMFIVLLSAAPARDKWTVVVIGSVISLAWMVSAVWRDKGSGPGLSGGENPYF
jgi:hypothetical protein